jgi:hypothetical protein
MDVMSSAHRQLLVYTFAPGSSFEGQLVGALERIESGGAMRILDVLFVGRDAASGELVAVSMSTDGAAGMVGRLVSFRLERGARERATARVLESPAAGLAQSLAAQLEPGGAVAAILVEHAWEQLLAEAIARLGGAQALNDQVDASEVIDVADRLADIASRQQP